MSLRNTGFRIRQLLAVSVVAGISAADGIGQAPQPLPTPTPVANGQSPAKIPERKLSIGECLAIAEASHPSIKMAEAGLSQTMKGAATLNKVPPVIGGWLRPDLPFRKQQTTRGIDAAIANCSYARQLVINDVCRMYYTYIYAKQQELIVNEISEQLDTYKKIVEKALEGPPDPNNKLKINKTTLDTVDELGGQQ